MRSLPAAESRFRSLPSLCRGSSRASQLHRRAVVGVPSPCPPTPHTPVGTSAAAKLCCGGSTQPPTTHAAEPGVCSLPVSCGSRACRRRFDEMDDGRPVSAAHRPHTPDIPPLPTERTPSSLPVPPAKEDAATILGKLAWNLRSLSLQVVTSCFASNRAQGDVPCQCASAGALGGDQHDQRFGLVPSVNR